MYKRSSYQVKVYFFKRLIFRLCMATIKEENFFHNSGG